MPEPSRITAGELVLVCSRYDLGAIQSLRRYRGGSRDSPKVLVVSDRGRFLIKRRAPGHTRIGSAPAPDDLARRVALSHQVQLHLAARAFPVAPLVGTRAENNSLLELNGSIYEVFRFIDGRRYDRTPAAAAAAGRLLALLHRELRDLHPLWPPSEVTYHNQPAVVPTIRDLAERASLQHPRFSEDLAALRDVYLHAAAEAERLGLAGEVPQLIHADWHPGNLLYTVTAPGSDPSIAAVLDFDSVRLGRPVIDLANGALQFAMLRESTPAAGSDQTPGLRVHLDPDLFREFCSGYQSQIGPGRVHSAGLPVVPWLMIEAVVVETLAPIAATGRFGKVSARAAIAMSRRATSWLQENADRLVSLASGR